MTITKSELLDALRTSGEEVLEKLKNLPEEDFAKGRYENGWNGKQILAHISSIEWTYPRLIDLATSPRDEAKPEPATSKAGIGSYNDRQVAKREDWSISELLAEFEANRAATIAAVEEVDEDTLAVEITSAGGIQGSLSQVLGYVAVAHVRQHSQDILGSG